MTAPDDRSPGRPRSATADAAILRAARELLAAEGVAGAGMEQVARRAGVSKVTVYRRWRGKEELLAAAFDSAGAGLPTAHGDLTYSGMTRVITDALPHAARVLADPHYRALLAAVFGARFTHPRLLAVFWDSHIVPRRRTALVVLARAVAEGRLPAGTDTDALLDMTVGAVLYRLLQPGDLTPDELGDYLARVYRQAGLLPASGEPRT